MTKAFISDSSKIINGIKYVDSNITGFSRLRKGKEFSYRDQHKKKITDAKVIQRIKSLVIPPNWKKVWICPYANGHIQVTGLDDKGRKQYIYHEDWISMRNNDKFSLLLEFGKSLSSLRNKINKDINRENLDLQRVSALALKIIDGTSMRPGNNAYQKQNGSYGLTTLEKKHLSLNNNLIHFKYKGKKGVAQQKVLNKKSIYYNLKLLNTIPGKSLFKYYDNKNKIHKLNSSQLNTYLQDYFNKDITCKTFRTWNACYISLEFLLKHGYVKKEKDREHLSKRLVEKVANDLGNTVSVARKNYIFPKIITEYIDGKLDNWIFNSRKHANKQRRIHKKLLKIIAEA